MGVIIESGTVIKSNEIARVELASGYKSRAVLFGAPPQILAKAVAFDEVERCMVECETEEFAVKYRLKPHRYYYYLLYRLSTNKDGDILSDDVTLEYLRLSQGQYEGFKDACMEMGSSMTSVVLTKVDKKIDGGKDVSYIEVKPSANTISEAIKQKVEYILAQPGLVNSLLGQLDIRTSLSQSQYIERKAQKDADASKAMARELPPLPNEAPVEKRGVAKQTAAADDNKFGGADNNSFGGTVPSIDEGDLDLL